MNHLNSIILEGEAKYQPTLIEGPGLEHTSFLIRNKRNDEYLHMVIVAEGNLAKLAHREVEQGSMLRVVGRLERDLESMKLYIKADHLEVRKDGQTTIS